MLYRVSHMYVQDFSQEVPSIDVCLMYSLVHSLDNGYGNSFVKYTMSTWTLAWTAERKYVVPSESLSLFNVVYNCGGKLQAKGLLDPG